jgi:hypothetical protein
MVGPARSNGLTAASWTSLSTVDPRLISSLLTALAEAGIAARSEPATGTKGPYLDVRLPTPPQDQVFVDATHVAEARRVLDRVTGDDTDSAFDAIVAGWEGPTPEADWPTPLLQAPEPSGVWRGSDAPLDPDLIDAAFETVDDAHYEAPPPPPVPRPSWQAIASATSFVVGLLLVVWSTGTDRADHLWMFVGVAGIAGGVAGLILRLRDGRSDPEDPWDDGARV